MEPQFLHPVTSPAPAPLHHPHGNIAVPASRQSCRALKRHHFRSREARDLQSCLPPHRDLHGSGCAAPPPSRCGGAPGRAPAPLARGGRPVPPRSSRWRVHSFALAPALGPPWSAVLHTARCLSSPAPAPVRPRRAPPQGRRGAPPVRPVALPRGRRKKTKAKMRRGLGWWWWWRRV